MKKAEKAISVLGGKCMRIEESPVEGFDHNIAVIEKIKNTPMKFPRKAGTPERAYILIEYRLFAYFCPLFPGKTWYSVEEKRYRRDKMLQRKTTELPLEQICTNPDQPRKFFAEEELNDLKNSIAEYGVLQPVIVKKEIGEYS